MRVLETIAALVLVGIVFLGWLVIFIIALVMALPAMPRVVYSVYSRRRLTSNRV